ncbi:predicted protein [Sclerotinia sclerotiorum 1980 UF-70]|uniref:Uncharacterized protein n=1 Tax=Sclerotinia sclerotiorum (strain ATCC 18683 / 1980 / Ss-1) TaxID=665079 RepID=A7F213_SCLS1|nr:predicted protein [Sclerotinia sclerotiorum 1980 UF-70]EDN95755.1 predicted protein [Sclerotinia sclerotiorum 1980 UF-70]
MDPKNPIKGKTRGKGEKRHKGEVGIEKAMMKLFKRKKFHDSAARKREGKGREGGKGERINGVGCPPIYNPQVNFGSTPQSGGDGLLGVDSYILTFPPPMYYVALRKEKEKKDTSTTHAIN